eukprot:4249323-Pleurochrysis_carterae.AAC.1
MVVGDGDDGGEGADGGGGGGGMAGGGTGTSGTNGGAGCGVSTPAVMPICAGRVQATVQLSLASVSLLFGAGYMGCFALWPEKMCRFARAQWVYRVARARTRVYARVRTRAHTPS